jgi:hypothetical protein
VRFVVALAWAFLVADFDGQPGSFRLASHDTAAFTRSDGLVLRLVRHAGPKEFRICS